MMSPFERRYQHLAGTAGTWFDPAVQASVAEDWKSRVAKAGQSPGRLIEFGCGTGENLEALRLLGWETEGLEIAESAVGILRSRYPEIAALVADLGQRLDPPPMAADIVLDGDCYHFQIGPRRPIFLQNVRQCLRPGGWFILSTNLFSEDLPIPDLDRDQRISYIGGHPTNYWATEWEVLGELVSAGFRVERLEIVQRDFTSLVAWATLDT